jgi:threonine dehydrogenase-like Zn-dependent dehydrogenase
VRELTFVKKAVLEWRDVEPPAIEAPGDALVRPFVASRCDGDSVFLFHDFSRVLDVGAKVGAIDPNVHCLGARPFAGPFPYGHECVAEVVAVGEGVKNIVKGQSVIVPWAVSCGTCETCVRGLTSKCERNKAAVSGYGFGRPTGAWGGMVCDLLRVPFADHMLVPVPDGVDPVSLSSASDNIPDAWRTVAPHLAARPEAPVLVIGGAAKSIGLYAAAIAVALGSSRVDYEDDDETRLTLAAAIGARPIPRTRSFTRRSTERPERYPISVDASSSQSGLQKALRALAPGGVCTSVGFHFRAGTKIPLWTMYLNHSTLRVGLSNPRADLPGVLALVASGRFDPARITSLVADWEDAPEAFLEPGSKVVVARARLGG